MSRPLYLHELLNFDTIRFIPRGFCTSVGLEVMDTCVMKYTFSSNVYTNSQTSTPLLEPTKSTEVTVVLPGMFPFSLRSFTLNLLNTTVFVSQSPSLHFHGMTTTVTCTSFPSVWIPPSVRSLYPPEVFGLLSFV